jgi:hypothetical protein
VVSCLIALRRSYVEVEKILDVKEQEVSEVFDDLPPPPQEVTVSDDTPGCILLKFCSFCGIYRGHNAILGVNESVNTGETAAEDSRVETSASDAISTSDSAPVTSEVAREDEDDLVTGNDVDRGKNEANTADAKPQEESTNEFVPRSVHQIFNHVERCRHVLDKIWDDPFAVSFQVGLSPPNTIHQLLFFVGCLLVM